jgi:hypothetical protein
MNNQNKDLVWQNLIILELAMASGTFGIQQHHQQQNQRCRLRKIMFKSM